MITSGPYSTISKDPIDCMSKIITSVLRDLNKVNCFNEQSYQKLRPNKNQPPRIYGLPKIHKPDTPLRHIVSCVNSFSYNLSKFLSDILSPLTGLSEHTAKCSTSFADYLRLQSIQYKEIMVSFDVESLFANDPIEAACSIAEQVMQTDKDFTDRTNLSPSHVTNLFEFVLRSSYFMYNRNFFEQLEGIAMGSPVSAVIANLFMENFEQQALRSCPPKYTPQDLEEICRRHLHSHHKVHCQ